MLIGLLSVVLNPLESAIAWCMAMGTCLTFCNHKFLFVPALIALLTELAEVERSLIRKRTLESVQHRREIGGKLGGRPKTNQAKERLLL
jgi:DNA invertase Pin-like site-specific DNA recombinase